VRAIFTAADIGHSAPIPTIGLRLAPLPELEPFAQPVIAVERVRYVGEPLGIIVADSVAQAEDARDAIEVDIEPLPAVTDRASAMRGEVLLFEAAGSNRTITYTGAKGDVSALKAGLYSRKERFSVQRHSAVCMEPRGLLAVWDGGATRLTVSGAAKLPWNNRRMLASRMDLPEDCVQMIEVDVGGGFGVRGEFYPEDYLVPFAARRLDRPVKWVEDRLENLLGSNHAREAECELEIFCERDGTLVALRAEAWVNAGAYMRTSGAIPPRNIAQFFSGPYRVPNIQVRSNVYVSNKAPIGTYRGPGRYEVDFFRERLFDLAAADLGIDRVHFRRRNLPAPSEFPYPLASLDNPEKHEALDSGDYAMTLERCLEEFGWEEKSALDGRLVERVYHGIAVGCFIEGGGTGPRENARMALEADGSVSLYIGSTNLGQGVETVCLQVASDALGLPMERLRVFHGSTTYLREGFGSYHSRGVVMGGSAILATAQALKKRIREVASERLSCLPEEILLGEGLTASFKGRSLSLQDLAAGNIEAEGSFSSHEHTYSYGAAAGHVCVDPRTGEVRVLDYVTVQDVGRVMNPLTARGQVIGGVVQGLGGVLLEHLAYDESGQMLAGSLADYLMPSATDYPRLRAVVLGHSAAPSNPLGAKGMGEGGTLPVGGVIANAVASALRSFGVQPNHLPLTPPRIWKLIESSRAS
jgi:carbon-monoxide dehydrogenase large subunit